MKIGVVTFPGTLDDDDAARAIRLAGADPVSLWHASDDLRAVGATISAVTAANVPFAFVLSQAPRAKITEEAVRVLAQHGRVAPVNIAQRVIYAETGASGAGVIETADLKAAEEIRDIWNYVTRIL